MRRIPVLLALALALACLAGCAGTELPADSTEPPQALLVETPSAGLPNVTQKEQTEIMTQYDFSDFPNVELIHADLDGMSNEQLAVLYQQARYCQTMTDADTDTLRELVPEDATFTHMSGRQQTREEYFADIENGNLRYFTIGIDSPVVTVEMKAGFVPARLPSSKMSDSVVSQTKPRVHCDTASVTFTSVLNANAYGARGTYRMSGTHHWEKRDGEWVVAANK